jgi:outer membrane protein assembly factor BamB
MGHAEPEPELRTENRERSSVNDAYYIVVLVARTTRCWVSIPVIAFAIAVAWGVCPQARQATDPNTDATGEITAALRREAIAREWRNAKAAPVPVVPSEPAWSVTLPAAPSAPGAFDEDRVYVPLRSNLLVALNRETGVHEWSRPIETALPPLAAEGAVYFVQGGRIHAVGAADGADRWSVPVEGEVTAPLAWDNGWLFAIVAPGEAVALRAADGYQVWRRLLGAGSTHPAVPGGEAALFFSLADSRLVALAEATGEPLWQQQLTGTISVPAVARDRVFAGSTDNFLYAFDADSGRPEWKWRNGGDVIGAAADGDVVYFASLDNIIRAVNRGNGNQRWKKPTGTRPTGPPLAFGGVVVQPGLLPAVTVFVGRTGEVMGTQAAGGDLVGPPLVDAAPRPFRVSIVSITREGVVEALRPAGLMFRETALLPMTVLPGRPIARERLQ